MHKTLKFLLVVLVLLVIVWHFWPKLPDVGRPEYFSDQTYNFETLRVLDDIAVAGGDNNEAAQAIRDIKVGDADGWYAAWKTAGDRATLLAARTQDPISKGNALLRARPYYRTSMGGYLARRAAAFENGKYRINMDTLQSQDDLIGLVRYLVDKESRHL